MIIENMSEGASLQEIKGRLDISNNLHERLLRDEKEYRETIKRGIRKSRAWWETTGRKCLWDREFSATLWYMNMKNRFGWRDKQDITSNDKEIGFSVKLTDDKK